jgi:hypothetical protein
MSILTDHARRLVIGPDGSATSAPIDPQLAGTAVRSFTVLGEGRFALGWVNSAGGSTASGVVLVDALTGRVLSRAALDGIVLGLGAASQRLYALSGPAAQPPQLARLDPASLNPLGPPAPVVRQNDIEVYGISVVAPQ